MRRAIAPLLLLTALLVSPALAARPSKSVPAQAPVGQAIRPITRADAEWRRMLTPLSYRVLRHHDTEPAFTGALWNEHRTGRYECAGCALPLFGSDTKFDSGTGWPSFWRPAFTGHVREQADDSYGMQRIEVACARCGGHLGHVFDDGPRPSGLRYCINSASLRFVPAR